MPDMSQFVTRDELTAHLAPLGEIRSMLREDIRYLREGQTGLSEQMREMDTRIVGRMDTANGRTAKLEAQLVAQDESAEGDRMHLQSVEKTATAILVDGCHQGRRHIEAMRTLVAAGVVPQADGSIELPLEDSPLGTLIQRHGKKAAVGGGLVGIGVLLPHVWTWLGWALTAVERLVGAVPK